MDAVFDPAPHAALARLTAEQTARLATLDPAWAPLDVPQPEPGDTIVGAGSGAAMPEAPVALAIVRTRVSGLDTPAAVWGTRVAHTIQLRVGSGADAGGIAAVLAAAVAEARARDAQTARGAGSRFGDGETIDDADRSIQVSIPAREAVIAQALAATGFRLDSVDGLRTLDRDAPEVPAGDLPFTAPEEADEDALTAGMMKLQAFDAAFMSNLLRENTEAAMRQYAREAIAAGPGWSAIVRGRKPGAIDAYLTITPPEESAWAASGLRVGTSAYVGFAWTEPHLRGTGLASRMLAAGEAHARAQGVEALLIGYAAQNPLSGPLWNRRGFRPVRAHWLLRP
ncbi:GNAT family N-acetyltransferase [Brevibacterium gallinarum]|uniref:GNAT family N-acetyltransferase n=1 Tax=Brevibacterium gallinarum TaxID=2762220 RepID=A0ABR8WQ88_9MICO|nr:GNAT family N-acetyltransferase [Brevibacterium gallinarum]MBD8019220.1 GNAT family N-acetyltransferase [Brevibacterium gallinarum]